MLQVQVLVQQHDNFIDSLFKRIKVNKWDINELQVVFPSTGKVIFTSSSTIIVDDVGYKTIYVKQMYVSK